MVIYRPEWLTTKTSPALAAADGGQAGFLLYKNYLVGKEIGHNTNLFLSLKYLMRQRSVPTFHKWNAKIMTNNFKNKLQSNNWSEKSQRMTRKCKWVREGKQKTVRGKTPLPFLFAKPEQILHVVNESSFEGLSLPFCFVA